MVANQTHYTVSSAMQNLNMHYDVEDDPEAPAVLNSVLQELKKYLRTKRTRVGEKEDQVKSKDPPNNPPPQSIEVLSTAKSSYERRNYLLDTSVDSC